MVHSGGAAAVEGSASPNTVVVQSGVMVVVVGDTLLVSWVKKTLVVLV